MDPISQSVVAAAVPLSVAEPSKRRAFALLGGLAGLAPDLDVFISSNVDTLLFLEYHRQFTHALAFIPIGAGIAALALHWLVRRKLTLRESYLACLLGYATHGALDACTSYGTQLFWPFSDYRVAWNNISVVDPVFTLPLLAAVVAAVVTRRRWLALAGIGWGLAYLLFGVVQNQRAEAAGRMLAEQRGHAPERLTAKAGFATLLVWKVVYEHDGRYYVDAIRTGTRTALCEGTSVPALDLRRDLPWLNADSQQAEDVERFRWFSDDYIALHPHQADHVIDIRYSVVPNQIEPLWGIQLDRSAGPETHARFIADRQARAEQSDAYAALLTGDACVAVASAHPQNFEETTG